MIYWGCMTLIKQRLPNGLYYYEVQTWEIQLMGGFGICDDCNQFQPEGGYLVPCLCHFQCSDCFSDWSARAKHYPEDDWVEEQACKMYEKMIPCTRGVTLRG